MSPSTPNPRPRTRSHAPLFAALGDETPPRPPYQTRQWPPALHHRSRPQLPAHPPGHHQAPPRPRARTHRPLHPLRPRAPLRARSPPRPVPKKLPRRPLQPVGRRPLTPPHLRRIRPRPLNSNPPLQANSSSKGHGFSRAISLSHQSASAAGVRPAISSPPTTPPPK